MVNPANSQRFINFLIEVAWVHFNHETGEFGSVRKPLSKSHDFILSRIPQSRHSSLTFVLKLCGFISFVHWAITVDCKGLYWGHVSSFYYQSPRVVYLFFMLRESFLVYIDKKATSSVVFINLWVEVVWVHIIASPMKSPWFFNLFRSRMSPFHSWIGWSCLFS